MDTKTNWVRILGGTFVYVLLLAVLFALTAFVFGDWNPDEWGELGRFLFAGLAVWLIFAVTEAAVEDDDA